MVKLYLASGEGLDIEAALNGVSQYRKSKVQRLHDDEKKRASLTAELLLKLACGRTDYLISPSGKPYFEDGSVHFSLSHCGGIAVCAVADSPCGVDLERVPEAAPLAVAKRFFTESEYYSLRSSSDAAAEFCELWVKKEAALKAIGVGLKGLSALDISEYPIALISYGDHRIGICLPESEIGETEIYVQEDISQII